MPFGVRNNPVEGGTPATFYACPLCKATYEKRADLVDHLVSAHGMSRKEANALTMAT